MKTPNPIEITVEVKGASFVARDYLITLERRAAPLVEVWTDEPVAMGSEALVYTTFLKETAPYVDFVVNRFAQVSQTSFMASGEGLARLALDSPFCERLLRADLNSCLAAVAEALGLTFVPMTPVVTFPMDWLFLSTVRNAFDQLWRDYELTGVRWHLDFLGGKLLLLPALLPGLPIEIDELAQSETEKGIITDILPNLRPFLPVSYRGETRVIDKVVLNGKTKQAQLDLAGPED